MMDSLDHQIFQPQSLKKMSHILYPKLDMEKCDVNWILPKKILGFINSFMPGGTATHLQDKK